MAKTYEAMSKSDGSLNKKLSNVVFLRPDLIIKNSKNMEQLGNLGQKIVFFMKNHNAGVFHFTSSQAKEGVSSIVSSAAYYMAEKRSAGKILLIDANFQQPVLYAIFNASPSPGLRDVLSDSSSLSKSIHPIQLDTIGIMPCGKGVVDISARIGQERFSDLILELKKEYDCIIIDSPPILSSSDSLSLAIASDFTFIVVQANRTVWEVAKKSKDYLEKNGCLIGGVLLNRFTPVIPGWIYKRL